MSTLQINYWGRTRAWWVVLLVGVLTIFAGFAYWFFPFVGYAVAAQLFGWLLIMTGVVQLCIASGANRSQGWGWWLAAGVVAIFIGFVLIRNVVFSEAVLPYFLAVIFFFQGIQSIMSSRIYVRRYSRWLAVINGILLLIISYFFIESGWVANVVMVSFLVSIAFIYWGFNLTLIGLDLRPENK